MSIVLLIFLLERFALGVRTLRSRPLACSASHCSLFLHLTSTPSSATGSGALVRPYTGRLKKRVQLLKQKLETRNGELETISPTYT